MAKSAQARIKQRRQLSELEIVLKALKQAEKQLERAAKRKADWSLPGARAEYVKRYKRERRESQLPKDRMCPCGCGKGPVTKSRSWVVLKGVGPMLRSCVTKKGWKVVKE